MPKKPGGDSFPGANVVRRKSSQTAYKPVSGGEVGFGIRTGNRVTSLSNNFKSYTIKKSGSSSRKKGAKRY